MNLLKELWRDESGVILSAEAVVVGTVCVIGGSVGLNLASRAVNDELKDVAYSIRSLDQSYAFEGFKGCGSFSAGSEFTQQDVKKSLNELCDLEEKLENERHQREVEARKELEKLRQQLKKEQEDHKKAEENRKRKPKNTDDDDD